MYDRPVYPRSRMYHILSEEEWLWLLYWLVVFAVNSIIIYLIWDIYYASIGALLLHPFLTEFSELWRSKEQWSEFEIDFYKHETMSWKTKHLVKSYFIATILVLLILCNLKGCIEWVEMKKYICSSIVPIVIYGITYIIERKINKKHMFK